LKAAAPALQQARAEDAAWGLEVPRRSPQPPDFSSLAATVKSSPMGNGC